jgi:hypothetical protein
MADGNGTRKKRTGTYYREVAMEYLSKRGVDGVRALHAEDALSRATVKAAIKQLRDDGHDTAAIEGWYAETFGRGPQALVIGEKRPIKVQQGKRGGPYIRVALPSNRFKKGDTVYEEAHEDGRFVIGA